MRTNQLKLQIEDDSDERKLAQLWRALGPTHQGNVARAYARMLIKAARVPADHSAEQKKKG
jgi:hypothetical protein